MCEGGGLLDPTEGTGREKRIEGIGEVKGCKGRGTSHKGMQRRKGRTAIQQDGREGKREREGETGEG